MKTETITIKQAKNEIMKLENQLDVYLTKKKINFLNTQPHSIRFQDALVNGGKEIFDKFAHYQIKDEEFDVKIYELTESILNYQQFIIKEMKRMSKYDEIGLICYLREEENKNWNDIDTLLHMGHDYSRTKYKRYKEKIK